MFEIVGVPVFEMVSFALSSFLLKMFPLYNYPSKIYLSHGEVVTEELQRGEGI